MLIPFFFIPASVVIPLTQNIVGNGFFFFVTICEHHLTQLLQPKQYSSHLRYEIFRNRMFISQVKLLPA